MQLAAEHNDYTAFVKLINYILGTILLIANNQLNKALNLFLAAQLSFCD